MNNISKHVLYNEVTKAIENDPLTFQPLLFLKNFDFESTVEWILKAIDDYDKLWWTYDFNDVPNKCLVVKVWRETKKINRNEFGPCAASYFECLSHCMNKYPGSFVTIEAANN